MKQEKFEQKLNDGDFKYKGFNISMLPNWNSDGKTCIANKGNKTYRGTISEIYELLFVYEFPVLRENMLNKYFNTKH